MAKATRHRVLIIEDNDMLSEAYSFMLRSKGYDVRCAYDGEQGLALAEDFHPDVILLDYLMPKMDGKTFLTRYDIKRRHQDVKVLLLTNLSDADKIDETLQLGVQQHLLKSQMEPGQLLRLVDELAAGA